MTSKYGNKKVTEDGYTFDSKAEYQMYRDIKLLVKCHKAMLLGVHLPFIIFPEYTNIHGKKVKAITYEADFLILDMVDRPKLRVLDCKGAKTDVFKLKEKMFNSSCLAAGVELEYDL